MRKRHFSTDLFHHEVFLRNPHGMLIVSPSGDCIDANPAASRLLGMAKKHLLGQKVARLLSQTSSAATRQLLKQLLTESANDIEFRYTGPDRDCVYVSISGSSLSNGNSLIVLRDVTKRREMEDAFRKQAQMLDFANDTIMIRDLNDIISYWNHGAERLYGWKREEAIGQYVHAFLRTVFPFPLEKVLNGCLRTGHWRGILIHARRDGSWVTVASRWTLVRDESGKPTAFLEINNDITEQRKAEENLKREHEQLEQRVIERTQELSFANTRLKALSARLISAQEEERRRIARDLHDDLGQILTSTSLNLQRLSKVTSAKREDLLSKVLLANQEARDRIRAIAWYLRPAVLDDVGLKEALYTYVSEYEKETGLKCELVFRCSNTDFTDTVSTSIYRITQEALTNISKYAQAKSVFIQLFPEGAGLVLRIRDDGIGFNQNAIRVDRTLGLLGMKERSELIGGEFHLISQPGKGTEVLVRFPRRRREKRAKMVTGDIP